MLFGVATVIAGRVLFDGGSLRLAARRCSFWLLSPVPHAGPWTADCSVIRP